jgi:hypothetical protein
MAVRASRSGEGRAMRLMGYKRGGQRMHYGFIRIWERMQNRPPAAGHRAEASLACGAKESIPCAVRLISFPQQPFAE